MSIARLTIITLYSCLHSDPINIIQTYNITVLFCYTVFFQYTDLLHFTAILRIVHYTDFYSFIQLYNSIILPFPITLHTTFYSVWQCYAPLENKHLLDRYLPYFFISNFA